ncbi:hypothetical protein FKM82_011892 [Ascaphus truei]|uniref:proteinase-activated receptor 3-like n=1 Tax=Ascaphus truei TaxID=8439 RepID=UPI003F597393
MDLRHFAMTTSVLHTSMLLLTLSSLSRAACSIGADIPVSKGRSIKQDNCNSSILEGHIQKHLKSPITTIIVPTVYLVVFLIGLPANGIAFWVLTAKTKKMPSTLLLLNLALADLLFMLALPFKITYHYLGNNWIFGETLCRTVTAIFYGNMYCSILFLMGISIDRYVALVHPFVAMDLRRWRISIVISIGIWLVVIAAMSLFLFVPQSKSFEEPSITTCHDIWATCNGYEWYTQYFLGLFSLGFAIPLAVVLFCYVSILVVLTRKRESHRHVIQLIVLVLLTFTLCFTPSNILLFLHYKEQKWECHNQLYIWYMVAVSLCSFNSCIDPFIYYYISHDFRTILKDTFSCGTKSNSEASGSTKKSNLVMSSDNKEAIKIET